MKHNYYNFMAYLTAEALFMAATRSLAMLFSWIMIHQINQTIKLGWLLFISWIFQVIMLTVFGNIGDSKNKKHVAIGCATLSFILSTGLVLFSRGRWGPICLVFWITSILSVFLQAIGSSIVPQIYPHGELKSAFSYRGLVSSINVISGPALFGLMIHFLDIHRSLWMITGLLLLSITLWLTVSVKPIEARQPRKRLSGIWILLNNPTELYLATVSASFNFFLTPLLSYLVPMMILKHLKLGALWVGLSEACFGLGMLLGSMGILPYANRWVGKGISSYLGAMAVAFGVLMMALSTNSYYLCLSMLLCGIGLVIFNVNTTSIRCLATPPVYRSSLESVFLAFCIIPIPFGMIAATYVTNLYSPQNVLLVTAACLSIIALLVLKSPSFIRLSEYPPALLDGCYASLYPRAFAKKHLDDLIAH